MKQNCKLVVFDFDGTLSARDANAEFIKFCFAHSIIPWLFIPVIIAAMIVRLFNKNGSTWREMTRVYMTPKLIKRLKPAFIKQHKLNRFGWSADRIADEHFEPGVKVILISAGMDWLIPELVSDMDFDVVITSQTESARPWKFKFFCYYENKVVALNNWAKKNNINPVIIRSYGDSTTDIPLMNLADEQVWIDRKTGIRTTSPSGH